MRRTTYALTKVNPFVNRTTKLSLRFKLRYVFPGIVLIPLRVPIVAASVLAAYFAALIATFGVSKKRITQAPLRGWRGALLRHALPWSCRGLLFGLGFNRIQVIGKPVSKLQAPILVCNHQAPWEALALFYFHRASFITADGNYNIPFIGTGLYAAQLIKVNRHSKDSRLETQEAVFQRAKDPAWPQVGIFPEGTTTNGTALINFKLGAFTPLLPVQPVVVKYPHYDVDPSWAGFEVGVGAVALRLMARLNNRIVLQYLPVHAPTEEEKKNPHLFAEAVRKEMATALGVEMTQHSLEDLMLQNHAKRLKLDPKAAVVGMEYYKSVLHFGAKDAKEALEQFAEYDSDHSGTIRYSEFLAAVGLADSDIMREAWATVSNWQDEMNFQEFLEAMARISDSEMAKAKTLMQNFKDIDEDGDSCLSFDELFRLVKIASPQCTKEQVAGLMKRMESPQAAVCLDVIEFSSFLRDHPLLLLLFDLTLKHKREKLAAARGATPQPNAAADGPQTSSPSAASGASSQGPLQS